MLLLCVLVGIQLQQGAAVAGPFPAHDLGKAQNNDVEKAAYEQSQQPQQQVQVPGVGGKESAKGRCVRHVQVVGARRDGWVRSPIRA